MEDLCGQRRWMASLLVEQIERDEFHAIWTGTSLAWIPLNYKLLAVILV
jgi:hypothetical protein